MLRKAILSACSQAFLLSGGGGAAAADARRHLREAASVHPLRPADNAHPHGAEAGRAYGLKPVLSNGAAPRPRARHVDAEARRGERDGCGRQRRPLHLGRRHPLERADPGRRSPHDAAPEALHARRGRCRQPACRSDLDAGHLAGLRPATADPARQPSTGVNDLSLHAVLRRDDADRQRRVRGRSLAVPVRDAERRPGRLRLGEQARRDADPARRRRAGGARDAGPAHGRRSGDRGHRQRPTRPASGMA